MLEQPRLGPVRALIDSWLPGRVGTRLRTRVQNAAMSELADRSIIALRRNHDDLAARVAGFTADDLARTSGATEWDVAQVLSHLGSGAEIGLAVLTAGLAGDPLPDNDFNQGVWARWDGLERPAKADNFVAANGRLVAALEELPAQTREDAAFSWLLPFPIGIELFAGMRLSEAVQHGWDVRVAFDPAATLPAESAGVLLDVLTGPASFMVGFVGKAEPLAGTTANLAVRTTDPEREFGLALGEQIGVGPTPADPDGVLRAPAEAVDRLIAGRLRPEHTPDGVELTGPITLAQLRHVFPGV